MLLGQMHVSGDEAEKVGLGSQVGLGMQARAGWLQLIGCVKTSEDVIVLVQEKKRRSVKADSVERIEETALRDSGWVEAIQLDDHLDVVMRQREEVKLTSRFLTQVADSLKPLTSHQDVGEEKVGYGHEGGFRCGYAEFWVPMATSGENVRQAFGVEFGELTWASSAFG